MAKMSTGDSLLLPWLRQLTHLTQLTLGAVDELGEQMTSLPAVALRRV